MSVYIDALNVQLFVIWQNTYIPPYSFTSAQLHIHVHLCICISKDVNLNFPRITYHYYHHKSIQQQQTYMYIVEITQIIAPTIQFSLSLVPKGLQSTFKQAYSITRYFGKVIDQAELANQQKITKLKTHQWLNM